MRRWGVAGAIAGLVVIASPAAAEMVGETTLTESRSAAAQMSSQETRSARPPRAPVRIEVRPIRREVRECQFWLAQEVRASGTYVVPRQTCWWAPQP